MDPVAEPRKVRPNMSAKYVIDRISYDSDTGSFLWKSRTVEMFKDGKKSAAHECAIWNAKHSGKKCGRLNTTTGYLEIAIDGVRYQAHRLAFLIMVGEWPDITDHINNDRLDNRGKNLRSVSSRGNAHNSLPYKNCSSAFPGVSWDRGRQKWISSIFTRGQSKYLGRFVNEQEAASAYASAKLFYHDEAPGDGSMTPIFCVWNGSGFEPLGNSRKACESRFITGERCQLEVVQERSAKSHAAYFAAVNEAWRNIPEDQVGRFASPLHLRKYALIKAGYHDKRSIVCSSKVEAGHVAAFVKPMDPYAVVTISRNVVEVYTAVSQDMRSMDRKTFQKSKTDVLDIIAGLIGVTSEQLSAARAA